MPIAIKSNRTPHLFDPEYPFYTFKHNDTSFIKGTVLGDSDESTFPASDDYIRFEVIEVVASFTETGKFRQDLLEV